MKAFLMAVAVLVATAVYADASARFIIDSRKPGVAQYEAVTGDGLVTYGLTGSQPDNPNRQWSSFKVGSVATTLVSEFKALADCRLSFMIGLNKNTPESLAVTSFKVNGKELLADAEINPKTSLPVGFYGPRANPPRAIEGTDGAVGVVIALEQMLSTSIKMQNGQTYRVEVTLAAVK